MRKVIVHIGQPKTGTTTLQRALLQNSASLCQQGFVYPKPKFGINHAGLAVPFMRQVQRSIIRHFGSDLEEARRISMTYWQEAAEEVAAHPSATVILSSEFFYSAPELWKITQTLSSLLGESVETVFIVYMRVRSEHYVSLVQQKLKASHMLISPPELSVDRLEELAAIAEVKVKKFSRDSMVRGDITSDFCTFLGIDSSRFSQSGLEDNKSISAEGMILLQNYRARYCADEDNVFTDDTRNFIRAIVAEETVHPERYTRPKLRPDLAQWMDQDSPALEWLRANHGVDLHLDHGVGPAASDEILKIRQVADLISFDPEALADLSDAVNFLY